MIYDDINRNGSQETGEPGIAGATVTLTDNNREVTVTRTTVTDANGAYTFASVPVGQYSLVVELPPGQNAVVIPPVQVSVGGSNTVTVPPMPIQKRHSIYLPSVQGDASAAGQRTDGQADWLYLPAVQR